MIDAQPRIQTTKSMTYDGLSEQDIQARIQRGETNDFEARVGRTYGQIVFDNIFNLFNIVLGTRCW